MYDYLNYAAPGLISQGWVTVYDYQRGLLYRNGHLERVLEGGRYRLWKWRHERIALVDMRRQTTTVHGQKLQTSDQVPVTLNLSADFQVVDPALARHAVQEYSSQLYSDVQLAARTIIGSVDIDTLLSQRVEMNARLLEQVAPLATGYGLQVLQVTVKDVTLSARVRDLLMKEVEARRVAQAMLIGAREEVAAMRALANAARLAEEHPALLRLRELEVARSMASTGAATLVMGMRDGMPISVHTTPSRRTGAVKEEADDTD